jgi:hypothetical protein
VSDLPGADPQESREFTPEQLDRTVLAIPLIKTLRDERRKLEAHPELEPMKYPIVADINLEYSKDRRETREEAENLIEAAIDACGRDKDHQGVHRAKTDRSQQYIFARLEGDVIRCVVDRNEPDRPIFRIWPDFEIGVL